MDKEKNVTTYNVTQLPKNNLDELFEFAGKLRNSPDHKDRFKSEYLDLTVRAERLRRMLVRYKDGTLEFKPNNTYEMLHAQYIFMIEYGNILYERAEIEHINLSADEVFKK